MQQDSNFRKPGRGILEYFQPSAAYFRLKILKSRQVAARAREVADETAKSAEAENVERTTLEQYEQHLRLYIIPILGRTKLSKLTAPMVRAFSERLREEGRSSTMIIRCPLARLSLGRCARAEPDRAQRGSRSEGASKGKGAEGRRRGPARQEAEGRCRYSDT